MKKKRNFKNNLRKIEKDMKIKEMNLFTRNKKKEKQMTNLIQ